MSDHKNKNILITTITIFVLIVYLITPPQDKIAQLGYLFNNTVFLQNKLFNEYDIEEYKFYRNNAIYLAKMGNTKKAIKEMNKAIASCPNSMDEQILYSLYRDRSSIKIYNEDYKGALDDLLMIPNPSINDNLKIAMLLKEKNNRKLAISYCNKIIGIDIKAYAGYACVADIYASVEKYEASIMIYDLLIDRVPNRAKYYADRAKYKKLAGDIEGYKEDLDKAKELSPVVDLESSITHDAIHPKKLYLTIL